MTGDRRWPLGRWLILAGTVLAVYALLSIGGGALALNHLSRARGDVLARLDPRAAGGGQAVHDLQRASRVLEWVLVAIAVGLAVLLAAAAAVVRRVVARPISSVATEVRLVAAGDYRRRIATTGPREIVGLAGDVEALRRRIVDELSALREAHEQLDAQAKELQRSNRDLEQFAYVASHDLQEPLRKVASFTQLLERRYAGRLDERAEVYIGFAVDGAKRMQVLINDLLAFSRVGRLNREHVGVDANDLVDAAVTNLSVAVREAGAEVTADDLPPVAGDESLLTAVFQNLLGNAVKFRGREPPRVHVGVRDDGEQWEFSVADNGIGIEPEYAERIFVIFQRLHAKDAHPGTGIGLAICRKIVEYHGGRIWLDSTAAAGSTFRFTLPRIEPARIEPARIEPARIEPSQPVPAASEETPDDDGQR